MKDTKRQLYWSQFKKKDLIKTTPPTSAAELGRKHERDGVCVCLFVHDASMSVQVLYLLLAFLHVCVYRMPVCEHEYNAALRVYVDQHVGVTALH